MYEPSYLQVWEDVNKAKLNIHAYRTHRAARHTSGPHPSRHRQDGECITNWGLCITSSCTLDDTCGSAVPEPRHIQGLEDIKQRPNLVFTLLQDPSGCEAHVGWGKTALRNSRHRQAGECTINEASYSHHFEPSHLRVRNNMNMRPNLIFELKGPVELTSVEGSSCRREAGKLIIIWDLSSGNYISSQINGRVIDTPYYVARMWGPTERAHLKIHWNSRWTTLGTREIGRPSLTACDQEKLGGPIVCTAAVPKHHASRYGTHIPMT